LHTGRAADRGTGASVNATASSNTSACTGIDAAASPDRRTNTDPNALRHSREAGRSRKDSRGECNGNEMVVHDDAPFQKAARKPPNYNDATYKLVALKNFAFQANLLLTAAETCHHTSS
jgi:hypothetical protein